LSAVARPMPLLAPVTSAAWPFIVSGILLPPVPDESW
jgi:hypothetical protein